MNLTTPMTITFDELWVFASYDTVPGIDAFRLGISTTTHKYGTFPPDLFYTEAPILPISLITGAPVGDYRWATIRDLDVYPLHFGLTFRRITGR